MLKKRVLKNIKPFNPHCPNPPKPNNNGNKAAVQDIIFGFVLSLFLDPYLSILVTFTLYFAKK